VPPRVRAMIDFLAHELEIIPVPKRSVRVATVPTADRPARSPFQQATRSLRCSP
jgi:hypothetical protein